MSILKKVLTFDIGIRNLAWCLMEKTETENFVIHGWENYDLLAGSGSEEAKRKDTILCVKCGKKASYIGPNKAPTCVTHCPKEFPAFRDLSGNLLKKLPGLAILKGIHANSQKDSFKAKLKSKQDFIEALQQKYSMPLVSTKATVSKVDSIAIMHDAIRIFVDKNKATFQGATHIFLENQPAFKNPTMKTVQILLFATLREHLLPLKPWVGFVHAGKKVQAEKGDKGYGARKKGSEDRTLEFFTKNTVQAKEKWQNLLAENQKKSDMCDALCMCLDQL